ncbi:extensin-1 [Lactuca sativa]|uniref:Extensin domain-containing protein n=1 Tax=Lactuca sativa TaxID=4236 RepID=A0A9R1UGT9_LACSA|nr:extensin-1 [Lactuca sativa]KAJ0186783.1 hypothetical protein LSAT_V11C900495290 [Lactuca sativa]
MPSDHRVTQPNHRAAPPDYRHFSLKNIVDDPFIPRSSSQLILKPPPLTTRFYKERTRETDIELASPPVRKSTLQVMVVGVGRIIPIKGKNRFSLKRVDQIPLLLEEMGTKGDTSLMPTHLISLVVVIVSLSFTSSTDATYPYSSLPPPPKKSSPSLAKHHYVYKSPPHPRFQKSPPPPPPPHKPYENNPPDPPHIYPNPPIIKPPIIITPSPTPPHTPVYNSSPPPPPVHKSLRPPPPKKPYV